MLTMQIQLLHGYEMLLIVTHGRLLEVRAFFQHVTVRGRVILEATWGTLQHRTFT